MKNPQRRIRSACVGMAVTAGLALLISACGSTAASAGSHATLTIANFDPFSGPNADYGYVEQAGCLAAVHLINTNGGADGHHLTCQIVDSRGDPADAVPAAEKMLTTTNNLVGIVDQDSGVLTATVPLFDQAHIPDISIGGDVPFDHNHYQYFWRTVAGDDQAGDALAAYIYFKTPYRRVAAMFGTDAAAQGNLPGLQNGAKNLGLHLVLNQPIAIDQQSYATEVQHMKSSGAQVFTSEFDPQTAGVLLGELKQAGVTLPGVLTSGTFVPTWDTAAKAAVGASTFKHSYIRVMPYAYSSGPAYNTWIQGLKAIESQVRGGNQDAQQFYSQAPYDNVNEIALAIEASHSTNPAVINSWIPKVSAGTTIVHTFAEGKAALAQGKSINYVGVIGQIHFDKYHNSPGIWAGQQPLTNKVITLLSPAELQKAIG